MFVHQRAVTAVRIGLVLAVLVLISGSGVALAEEAAPSAAGVAVACGPADVLGTASIFDQPEPVPQARCPQGFCSDNQDCELACPSALTAICSGYVCHYTYSGGGGGGASCNAFCTDTADCIAACPNVPGVYCAGYVCQT